MPKKREIRKISRSSITGQFITSETAKRHPKTSTTETVRTPNRRKKHR